MPYFIPFILLLLLCTSCQQAAEPTSQTPTNHSPEESREARQNRRQDSLQAAYQQSIAYIKNMGGLTGIDSARLTHLLDSLPSVKVPFGHDEAFLYPFPAHWETSFDTYTGKESGDTLSQNKLLQLESHLLQSLSQFKESHPIRELDMLIEEEGEEGKKVPYLFQGVLRKSKGIYSLLYYPYSILNVNMRGIILDKLAVGHKYLEGSGEGDTYFHRYFFLDTSAIFHIKDFEVRHVSDVMDASYLGERRVKVDPKGQFIEY